MNNWNPFFALDNTRDFVDNKYDEKNLVEMPILSEEELFEIEDKIFESITNNSSISIKYFIDGKIHVISGKISKVDEINKLVVISKKIVRFKSIISVTSDF